MSINQEQWKWVSGYEGLYLVSNYGAVMGLPRKTFHGHQMKQRKSKSGYMRVGLFKDGEKKTHSVHRLVAIAFVPNKNGKQEVNHINGDKADNRAENLEWVTRSENELHSFRVLGRQPNRPWKNKPRKFARKFTDEQVRKIRNSNKPRSVIAKEYGVSKTAIYQIVKRKSYAEVI